MTRYKKRKVWGGTLYSPIPSRQKPLSPKSGAFDYMGNVKPSDIGLTDSPKLKGVKLQAKFNKK